MLTIPGPLAKGREREPRGRIYVLRLLAGGAFVIVLAGISITFWLKSEEQKEPASQRTHTPPRPEVTPALRSDEPKRPPSQPVHTRTSPGVAPTPPDVPQELLKHAQTERAETFFPPPNTPAGERVSFYAKALGVVSVHRHYQTACEHFWAVSALELALGTKDNFWLIDIGSSTQDGSLRGFRYSEPEQRRRAEARIQGRLVRAKTIAPEWSIFLFSPFGTGVPVIVTGVRSHRGDKLRYENVCFPGDSLRIYGYRFFLPVLPIVRSHQQLWLRGRLEKQPVLEKAQVRAISFKEMAEKYDKDGNGRISHEEYAYDELKRYDADGDGVLVADELAARFFTEWDLDHDDAITPADYLAHDAAGQYVPARQYYSCPWWYKGFPCKGETRFMEWWLERWDADGNGEVTRSEYGEKLLRERDRNGNGVVEAFEVTPPSYRSLASAHIFGFLTPSQFGPPRMPFKRVGPPRMPCPKCGLPLTTVRHISKDLNGVRLDVELEHCTRCGGVWSDRHALDAVLERYGSKARVPLFDYHEPRTTEDRCRCPVCDRTMYKSRMDIGINRPLSILIDACPNLHGHWFDAKDLKLLGISGVLEIQQDPTARQGNSLTPQGRGERD